MNTDNQSKTLNQELEPVLRRVDADLRLLAEAVMLAEAVHGVRLIEPRNDINQTRKELTWCIARLNGMTEQPCPTGDAPADFWREFGAPTSLPIGPETIAGRG